MLKQEFQIMSREKMSLENMNAEKSQLIERIEQKKNDASLSNYFKMESTKTKISEIKEN
jgi:hypothetical protein